MRAYILKLNKDANLLEQWDFGLIKDFLDGKLWKTANWTDFEIIEVKELPEDDRAIVLIAGRHHLGYEDEINKQLQKINKVVQDLYKTLQRERQEVIYDDRQDKTVGEKFADCDLMGIPYRLVVSEKSIKNDCIEVKERNKEKIKLVKKEKISQFFNG